MAENSNETAKKSRGKGKPFQPGQSGNPGGRPKKINELVDKCQDLTGECADVLANILKDEKERTTDRIKAAEIILAYGWGKPKQQTELTGKDGGPLLFIWEDTDE